MPKTTMQNKLCTASAVVIPFPRHRVVHDLDPVRHRFYWAALLARELKTTQAVAERLLDKTSGVK